MNERLAHPESRPRRYRAPISLTWWVRRQSYLKFMLRESSCVFVLFLVALTLAQISALIRGPDAYAEFERRLKSPFLIAISAVGLLFLLFHSITWFNLIPSAIVVRVGGKRVPDFLIAAPNYVAWLVVSGVVAWVLLGA